jgi:hypothetical protein
MHCSAATLTVAVLIALGGISHEVACSQASDNRKIIKASDYATIPPEELRTYIRESHDILRGSQAESLERCRMLESSELARQSLLLQWQYDVNHYEISFAIDFDAKIIDGYVTMTATSNYDSLSLVEIDLQSDMVIDSITMGGSQIGFSRVEDVVTVELEDTCEIGSQFAFTIFYNGHPMPTFSVPFLFSQHEGVDAASTQSQPLYARYWWPCKDYPHDKPDSVDVVITHPDDFICTSNGTMISEVDNGDGTMTTHWHESYPIATYLVSINVTNYVGFSDLYISTDGDSMPIHYWVYPENWDIANEVFPVTSDMMEVLEGRFGKYPFFNEMYAMTQYRFGQAGLEHQTNTSIGADNYSENVILHELAHQWWGNMITCDTWHDIWMNEGFGVYSEALWAESQGGFDAYQAFLDAVRYTDEGTVYCHDISSVWDIFTPVAYYKGAWVVHMLRHVLGDSLFFDVLLTYADDPRYKWGTVTTVEFRDLCEEITGMDLHQFFDDWVWGEFYPKYRYSYTYRQYGADTYVVYVHIRQFQDTEPLVFDMPIDIEVYDGTNYHPFTVYNDRREQDFALVVSGVSNPPEAVHIDRFEWILREVSTENYSFHIINDTLSVGTQYMPYIDSVIAAGGSEPYIFSVVSGSLPEGLELDVSSGIISGLPLQAGQFPFTVRARDYGYYNRQVEYSLLIGAASYIAGDSDHSGEVDIDDIVYLISHIFSEGPAPDPVDAGDADASCGIDIDDAVYLISYVFSGGPAPLPGCVPE